MKLALALFLLVPSSLFAQDKESQSYCTYVQEQAQAEAIRLRTPANETGVTQQPIVGGIPQKFSGFTNSLSDDKKSMLVGRAAEADCKLYTATTAIQKRLLYAVPSLEKIALQNRLTLIESALAALDRTIEENKKRVASQNSTVQSAYMLDTARSKLEMDKSSTTLALSAIYIPEDLPEGRLLDMAAEKQLYENKKQFADNAVQKQQDWNIAIALGARKNAFPVFGGKSTGAYGNFTITYNIGSHASAQHLEKSAHAYGSYKESQYNDAIQQIAALKNQLAANISAQEETLARLKGQDVKITEYLSPMKEVDTAAAIGFRNQLFVDSLALRVEIGNAQFRLDALRKYLAENLQ